MKNTELDLPTPNNTLAVVITFNPDPGIEFRIQNILTEVKEVLVIDNKSNTGLDTLEKIEKIPGVLLVRNPENVGVATGLNQALNFAYDHIPANIRWLLTFDQDTLVYPGMILQYQKILRQHPESHRIAILGTNYFCRSINDTRFHFKTPNHSTTPMQDWVDIHTVITSGSLMNLQICKMVGTFRDDFFIDHVDDEYCLRARQKGFLVGINRTALMEHTIGEETLHWLLWRKTGTSNHSPLRRYYMMRNHLYLVQEYLGVETKWVLNTVYSRLKMMILMLLFEDNRWVKFKHCVVGIKHGMQKMLGKKI